MGWMSWEKYGCQTDCVTFPDACINAQLFETQAKALVDKGFLKAGYDRVNIDDCYMDARDPVTNDLRADETRFPGGIPALSKKIRGLGFKFGVYNDIGRTTCAGNPGLNVSDTPDKDADAQLKRDVELMANEWMIDSIKIDGCARPANSNMSVTYPKLGNALNTTGRQILFSCSWPVYLALAPECNGNLGSEHCFPSDEIVAACSTWRVFKDIMDAWNIPGHAAILQIIDFYAENNVSLAKANGPGHYNDYDMLLAGNAGLSVEQARIQMTMWCMWSAPLMLSSDVVNMGPEFVSILTNAEVIAVDQDAMGLSASGVYLVNNTNVMSSQVSVWYKPLSTKGTRAVALLNTGFFDGSVYNLTMTSEMVGMKPGSSFTARDLWASKDLGTFKGSAQFNLQSTSVIMLRIEELM
eukprot:m.217487 g.217487  ORF g.217487 m.217487 type:complete len:411 (+) comp33236_c0_seq14:3-1235(+)